VGVGVVCPPHPRPLPCLRRNGFAQAGARGKGDNRVIFYLIDYGFSASLNDFQKTFVFLMRKAFHPENGLLTDSTQVPSEKQAISDLFAGAIGSFKNPSSHRDVDFTDPAEVAELIMFADQLIRITERRKPE
jgi:hypothetical protein